MADYSCSACEELRQEVPSLIVNGFDDTMCSSLKNDTGLSTSSGSNDCTDLNNLNDCLIGNMENEVDLYDVCNWKDYMKMFANNVWTVLKGIICAICGLWTNIHNIWNRITKLECVTEYLSEGASFRFDEGDADPKGSYVVAGRGVSFMIPTANEQHTSDVGVTYLGGALGRWTGSVRFYDEIFHETGDSKCHNWDNLAQPSTPRYTNVRAGNSAWAETGAMIAGGELIYEIRIKKSDYPQIKRFINGFGQESGGGGYHVNYSVFDEGTWASGQKGSVNEETGRSEHASSGGTDGHKVPSGYVYLQARMSYLLQPVRGHKYTPRGFLGIRINGDGLDC